MYLHRYKTTISCIIILFIFILYTISCICCSFSTPHLFAPTISCVCLCPYHSILCSYYILYSMYLLPPYLVPRSSSPLRPSSACILHNLGPYCTAHSIRADNVDPISRPREPHSLAVLGRPIKVHWPTHSRVISRILLYLVLYTRISTTIYSGFKQGDEFVHFTQNRSNPISCGILRVLHNILPGCENPRETLPLALASAPSTHAGVRMCNTFLAPLSCRSRALCCALGSKRKARAEQAG